MGVANTTTLLLSQVSENGQLHFNQQPFYGRDQYHNMNTSFNLSKVSDVNETLQWKREYLMLKIALKIGHLKYIKDLLVLLGKIIMLKSCDLVAQWDYLSR